MFPRLIFQSLLLLVLAGVAGVLVWRFHPDRPELYLTRESAAPGEITIMEARERQAAGPVIWLDARREQEYSAGHIPGALLLNEYDWDNLLFEAFPVITDAAEGVPVIIYCDGQECAASRTVREKLQQTPVGDRELLILRGGWPAWQAMENGSQGR